MIFFSAHEKYTWFSQDGKDVKSYSKALTNASEESLIIVILLSLKCITLTKLE